MSIAAVGVVLRLGEALEDRALHLRGILEEPVRDEAGGGVQQHDVAHCALLAVQHAMDDRGVVGGVAAEQVVDVGERDAEIARVEVVLVDVAAADLPQAAVAGGGELVEPVVAAEDERRGAARAGTRR